MHELFLNIILIDLVSNHLINFITQDYSSLITIIPSYYFQKFHFYLAQQIKYFQLIELQKIQFLFLDQKLFKLVVCKVNNHQDFK